MGRRKGRKRQRNELGTDTLTEATLDVDASEEVGAGHHGVDLSGDPAGLVRRGDQALEAYDYDTAREYFTTALERSGGSEVAARALLEFLVDNLAAYTDALEFEPRLARASLASDAVRVLLAQAAAKTGDRDRALGHLKGVTGARAADAYCSLAERALKIGDFESAERFVEQVRTLDPTAPQLLSLTDAIAATRAKQSKPQEEKLQALFDAGELDLAEQQARALLESWPASEVAPRILRQIGVHRRETECRAVLARAGTAMTDGEFDTAAACYEEALRLGAPKRAVERKLEEARHKAHQASEQARIDQVVGWLGEEAGASDPEVGLLAWLGLDSKLREQVRESCPRPELDWLEQADPPRSGSHAKAAVRAVIALSEAISALGRDEARVAIDIIDLHERWLQAVGRAREARAAAAERITGERRRDALDALGRAKAAVHTQAFDNALALLDRIDVDVLTVNEQTQVQQLRARARTGADVSRLGARVDELVGQKVYLEARNIADSLIDRFTGRERDGWVTRRGRIDAALRAFWAIVEIDDPQEAANVGLRDIVLGPQARAQQVIAGDGQTVVLAQEHARWIFVRFVDVSTRRVRRALVLKSPLAMGGVEPWLEGQTLWLLGRTGVVIELSLAAERRPASEGDAASIDVVRCANAADHISSTNEIVSMAVVPGTRLLWCQGARAGQTAEMAHVVDIDPWRMVRTVADCAKIRVLPGRQEPRVARISPNLGLGAATSRGTGATPSYFELRFRVEDATRAADGKGLIATGLGRQRGHWAYLDDAGPLHLIYADPNGRRSAPWLVSGSLGGESHVSATSLESGCTYVAFFGQGVGESRARQVMAVRASVDKFEELWRTETRRDMALATDAGGREIMVLVPGDDELHIAPLGRTAAALPKPALSERKSGPQFLGPFGCVKIGRSENAAALAHAGRLRHLSPPDWEWEMNEQLEKADATPEDLVVFGTALRHLGDHNRAADFARRSVDRFDDDARLRLLRADFPAHHRRWGEVRELLDDALSRVMDQGEVIEGLDVAHLCHLQGLAAALTGELDRAAEIWRFGRKHPSEACQLAAYVEFVDAIAAAESGPELPEPAVVVRSVVQADGCLAEHDPAGAIRALDHRWVWTARDRQSAARLTHAWLAVPEPDRGSPDWFRKLLAVTYFLGLMDAPPYGSGAAPDLPVPGATWTTEWLIDTETRARQWEGKQAG